MKHDLESLSDRERETLWLLGRGHDAKSIAAAFDLSVHTVNERLRAARRKLGARPAQRDPIILGTRKRGVAPAPSAEAYLGPARTGAGGAKRRVTVMIGTMMLVVLVSVLVATKAANGPIAASPAWHGAEPIYPLPSLFAVSDYPAEALAQRAQGITDFRLQVGEDGRVEKCDVERSSGSAALDEATCQVITRRSRFRPGTDAAGHAVDSIYTGMIHWVL